MKINKSAKRYLTILVLLAIVTYSFLFLKYEIIDFKLLIFWSILSIIVESLLIPLPNEKIGISMGSAINLAAIITGGPLIGATATLIGLLLRCVYTEELAIATP